ncbi:putative ATPase [Nitrospirillum amazonense]|uniref:Putative ATPase n=1 Tax=Nitrospirillum amazonense TaxID=28077 RepID=A0A560FSJ4_9PROT|nr:ATP-binding protein [Nitrospirillum amazonense]TWB24490.1 putative ATPase [Nitrospirillum amazonense]
MITSVEVLGYRAIRYLKTNVSSFQVLVGSNGTGKSTFFDVFQLVRDILNVGLDRSIFGDARFLVAQRASDPQDLTWLRKGGALEIAITLQLPESVKSKLKGEYVAARYEVAIKTDGSLSFDGETLFLLRHEESKSGDRQRSLFPCPEPAPRHIALQAKKRAPAGWRRVISKIAESGNDHFRSETSDWNNLFRLGPTKSALSNLPEDEDRFPASTWVKRFLMESVHRLALNAEAMRMPSPAGSPRDFLPDGSNLPWVVHELEQKYPDRLGDWVEHLKTAIDDIETIRTIERPEDRSRYLEVGYGSGLKAPSWLLSDGTLRMMALTLLAYTPTRPNLVLIEEPENGIHPRAIQSVIQSLSSVYDAQVFCATHSPLALSLVDVDQLLCFAKGQDGAVDVVRGDEHPRLKEWKSALHLGDLFATGVLG